MSGLTFKYFKKMHNMLLKQNVIEYQKGYEYAMKSELIQSVDRQELEELWKAYLEIGVRNNYNAFGHAYAIAEMLHEPVEIRMVAVA